MSNKMYKNMNIQDEYYTDARGVKPIIEFLKPNSTVGCPFDTENSQYVKVLRENGFKVIHSHIGDGKDFFKYEPNEKYDYIISNPPYSIKNEILKRLFELNKPFAMLIGVQALTIRTFMKLGREHNVKQQLLLFENKIFFENGAQYPTHYKKAGTYFHTYYFCNGGLPNDYIIKENI